MVLICLEINIIGFFVFIRGNIAIKVKKWYGKSKELVSIEKTIDRESRNAYNESSKADMIGGLQNEIYSVEYPKRKNKVFYMFFDDYKSDCDVRCMLSYTGE